MILFGEFRMFVCYYFDMILLVGWECFYAITLTWYCLVSLECFYAITLTWYCLVSLECFYAHSKLTKQYHVKVIA
jgi:hypothetical protein